MKNLLNLQQWAFALALVSLTVFAQAQTFKIPVKSGTLQIGEMTGKLLLEAYNGSEILIEGGQRHRHSDNERAKGLKPITGGNDNTQIGLNYKTEGEVTTIKAVRKVSSRQYTIKVPQAMKLRVDISNNWFNKLIVKGFGTDVNIDIRYGKVWVEQLSGSVQIEARYGLVTADFASMSNNVSIDARYGGMDISLPAKTKADLRASSRYGEIFTNMDIQTDKAQESSLKSLTATTEVTAKLNGGGKALVLEARHANIYLRKK
ncbi:DUF4097 family beta strand repeat-containing protein [Microscilla marina]|uniref:DUF4097 domain-containing protein n=1 Tax=Microscilla marina ATCC 23134 TaxID=313606 RepID=A1ZJF9_MICM2|nr:DUF4097 family beta strand repeat-containing protein [Microscilla marina]EAY29262.1 hypothetical protein M23134_01316 [Microscilla marina ATCC 23134]